MQANVNGWPLSAIALLPFTSHIRKAPLLHCLTVVDAGEHAPAANLHVRRRELKLVAEAIGQFI
jgi:hypothetical protein